MNNQVIHGFQLSPQQKHLWLLQQDNNSLTYYSFSAVEITGNLNTEVLKTALKTIINRHQILCTSFRCLAGMNIPIQVIENSSDLLIKEHDLRAISPEEQNNTVELLVESIKHQNFDLQKPSLQISLATLSESKYVLLLNLPALYADTNSLNNLLAEIARAYAGNLYDDEPVQYIVFSDWQNELLESEEAEIGRKYWREKDINHIFSLKLPNENLFSGKTEFKPQIFTQIIPPQVIAKINAIAENFNTTESSLLLTCWQILLWRLTNVPNMVVGTYCDGRSEEELQAMLGLLAKYVPVDCYLQGNLKFSEALEQISLNRNQAYEWQDCFNWELISGLFLPFCFEFIEQNRQILTTSTVKFSLLQQYVCFNKFKVKLSFIRTESSLQAEWQYDSELFLPEDIERLSGQFSTLLENAINHPDALLSQLEILSDIERQKLLVEFNNTQTAFPADKCFHQVFAEQVKRTPDNIAVVYKNQQFTYRELNNRANQLAHYLQKLGVKPDVMVGICVERWSKTLPQASPLMLIALLGILKAGGAYVPIDPNYPLERKAFIVKDSQMPVLLTQQHLMADLATNEIKVICLDSGWETINQQEIDNPITTTTALNLAYVIYTSGSTGKPKGTLIHHQGLVNYLTWATQRYAVEQGVGTVVHSPLGFDLTITSLLSPLLVGRTAELLSEEQGIETLSQALKKSSNLSLVKITPAHLDLLKQQLSKEEIANKTRAFIIGGENLLAESITFWQDVAPDTILVNEYGPTETVVGCCIYQVPIGKHTSGSIPIGKPIANTQLYILDQYLQPVPTGVAGELHIGGIGLARGYLNQPELTALKFIPNPFSKQAGDRLYKTGDLVRFLPSGDIEYIGRIDNQIKIRGFRVELGEIEAVINQHSSVSASVAIVREDKPGNQNLTAYITLHPDKTLTISELRRFLQNKLLDHMIPTAFMILEAFPLTSNGKVDRRALPMLDALRPELEVAYVLPQTEVEKTIASVWQKALNLEKIGIHDNFFEIGGHSLLLVTVHSQLQEILNNAELSTLDLFRYPTINSLAEYLSSSANQTVSLQETEIQTEKISAGKAQQRKRLQKLKSVENN